MTSKIKNILSEHDLTDDKLSKLLSVSCPRGIDFSDIYFEYSNSESWSIEDGIVKNGTSIIDSGVGIRSISGDKTGFAYSNTFEFKDLMKAAQTSRSIAPFDGETEFKSSSNIDYKKLYETGSPLERIDDLKKVLFLKDMDEYIRSKNTDVEPVSYTHLRAHET